VTNDVTYPIYLVQRDSVDIERFYDFGQLEEWVTSEDVANNRYLAWDYFGRPLTLGGKLDCKLNSQTPDGSLSRFLENAGTQYELSFGELNDEIDMELAFEKLKANQKWAIKVHCAKNKSKKFSSLG
jgi:hypothetical protein